MTPLRTVALDSVTPWAPVIMTTLFVLLPPLITPAPPPSSVRLLVFTLIGPEQTPENEIVVPGAAVATAAASDCPALQSMMVVVVACPLTGRAIIARAQISSVARIDCIGPSWI